MEDMVICRQMFFSAPGTWAAIPVAVETLKATVIDIVLGGVAAQLKQ